MTSTASISVAGVERPEPSNAHVKQRASTSVSSTSSGTPPSDGPAREVSVKNFAQSPEPSAADSTAAAELSAKSTSKPLYRKTYASKRKGKAKQVSTLEDALPVSNDEGENAGYNHATTHGEKKAMKKARRAAKRSAQPSVAAEVAAEDTSPTKTSSSAKEPSPTEVLAEAPPARLDPATVRVSTRSPTDNPRVSATRAAPGPSMATPEPPTAGVDADTPHRTSGSIAPFAAGSSRLSETAPLIADERKGGAATLDQQLKAGCSPKDVSRYARICPSYH